MADGTRLKVLDEHVHSLEQQLQELTNGTSKKFEELSHKVDMIQAEEYSHFEALRRDSANTVKKIEQLMELMVN